MTPVEVKAARQRLGLTQEQMAEALRLGKDGRRIVRGWEKGERKPSGPTTLAIEYLLVKRGDSNAAVVCS